MEVEQIRFELKAILGTSEIPLAAYNELRIGDLLILDQKFEEGLEVKIDKKTHYSATAGLHEMHKAIKIDKIEI